MRSVQLNVGLNVSSHAFHFFRQLVNYDAATISAAKLTDTHLDYFVADSAIDSPRSHGRSGAVKACR